MDLILSFKLLQRDRTIAAVTKKLENSGRKPPCTTGKPRLAAIPCSAKKKARQSEPSKNTTLL